MTFERRHGLLYTIASFDGPVLRQENFVDSLMVSLGAGDAESQTHGTVKIQVPLMISLP